MARQAAPASSPATLASWNTLVDEYFEQYFHDRPTEGTATGFHQFDSQMEDYSRKNIDRQIVFNRQFRARLEKFDPTGLPLQTRQDYELVLANINSTLLSLENIRQWERNPDRYSGGLANSAFVIMARKYASPEERLRSLIAREKQMPAVLAAARANLTNPPRVYTEVALEQIPGIIGFFQKDVPAAFTEVKDPALLAEFKEANQGVIGALEKYQNFLQEDLLPISHGDFRIGAANYRKKLEYDEMVDIPLDRLLEIGYEDLHRNQQRFKEVAAQIDAKKAPQEILQEMEKDHPTGDHLLESFRDVLSGLRGYIETQHIVTIPSQVMPIVEETPPFARALTSASMDTPGPYETRATEAYFNVTLPDSRWSKEQTEEWLEGFNRGTIISTAVHEAFPGHYTQFLWLFHAPSKVRKILGCGSNAEGWAHYTEQMMLDEGYGRTPGTAVDMRFLQLRLGQLQDALLRDARFIVGISMHTGKMTFDQAVDFFVKEGYQTHAVAAREAKRGTSDPTYLVYTLGKLQILKLREDYRKTKGDKFSLQEFHDSFLKQGVPPVKLIRETMLGNDSPVL
ncbi:MAG TPA: DUF885 domain-containing protein [Terriglobales bacterium]|nr:DUF885 domain-containing protein [Terriglobales bacterium]